MDRDAIIDKVKEELKKNHILACHTVDAKTGASIWKANNCDDVYVVEIGGKSSYSDYYMPIKNAGTGNATGANIRTNNEMLTAVSDVVHQIMQESGYVREKRKVLAKDIDINCIMVCIGIFVLFQFVDYLVRNGISEVITDLFHIGQLILGTAMILIGTNIIKVSLLNKCRLVFTICILAIIMSALAVLYILYILLVLDALHVTVAVWFAVTLLVLTFGFIILIWGYHKSVIRLK